MGGPPSTGTPADMRLASNKAKAGKASGGSLPAGFTNKPWNGNASRWPDAASYAASCLINTNTGPKSGWTKANCKLPVREPDGDYNVNAIHSAVAVLAGGMGGVQANPAAKKQAATKLKALYARLGEDLPQSVKNMA